MTQNKSGGTGCGWLLLLLGLGAAVCSLYVSGAVGAGLLTGGAVGMTAEQHDLAGVLLIVGLMLLGLAVGQKR